MHADIISCMSQEQKRKKKNTFKPELNEGPAEKKGEAF